MQFLTKHNRDRNKPLTKQTLPRLEAAAKARGHVAEMSREIRARHNVADQAHWGSTGKHWAGWLEVELPENEVERGARLRLEMLQARAASKGKPRQAKAKPGVDLSPAEVLAEIARRRAARKREEFRDQQTIAAMASAKEIPVAQIADSLGVTRQAVYQLAAA
jgi:hypothetical protein